MKFYCYFDAIASATTFIKRLSLQDAMTSSEHARPSEAALLRPNKKNIFFFKLKWVGTAAPRKS